MGKGFERVNLCVVGDLQYPVEKIKQWVENNGGKFSKQVSTDVTHMITTKESYRKSPAVREARRIRGLKIVSLDWLEDSLWSKSKSVKREGPYLMKDLMRPGKNGTTKTKGKAGKKATGKKTTAATGSGKKRFDSGQGVKKELEGLHVCKDSSGILYSAVLIRGNPDNGPQEKYTLELYESDAKPHTYTAHVKYVKRETTASQSLSPVGESWDVAYRSFTKFFKSKCGMTWDQGTIGSTEPAPKKDSEGNVLSENEGWFHYEVPKARKETSDR